MYIYLPNAPLFDVNNLLFASIIKGVITYPQLIIQENFSGAIFCCLWECTGTKGSVYFRLATDLSFERIPVLEFHHGERECLSKERNVFRFCLPKQYLACRFQYVRHFSRTFRQ